MNGRNHTLKPSAANTLTIDATATMFHRAMNANVSAMTAAPTMIAPMTAIPSPRKTGPHPTGWIPAFLAIGPHAPIGRARR